MGFLSKFPPVLLGGLLIGTLFFMPARVECGGAPLTATGDQLRALFVKRMIKYVLWPEGAAPLKGKPFIIAATDASKLRPYFTEDQDASKFKLVQWPAKTCHVLILTGASERSVAAILKNISGKPILTIGQNPANLRMGVMVNFIMLNGKLKFQINPEAADRVGLMISSRLLNLAQIYNGAASE